MMGVTFITVLMGHVPENRQKMFCPCWERSSLLLCMRDELEQMVSVFTVSNCGGDPLLRHSSN